MNLDQLRDQVKKLIQASPDFINVDDVEESDPHERVLGVESKDGELFFLVIQEP
ncbi:hypothetical protein ACFV42_48100 [Streptomyces solisilvae]|uniref:hypothetical protein n=1 Tax=Streptomyces malaysiensis TaxID=92644 RepID=UPI0036C9F807